MALSCVLFEDSYCDRLWPINLARADVRGDLRAYCLRELLTEWA